MIALRSSLSILAGFMATTAVVACSSSVTPETGTTGSSSTTSASSGGGGSASSTTGAGGAGGVFDPGGDVTTLDSTIGPITLSPGDERTQCVVVNLKNAEGAFVRRIRTELGSGSHHIIIYKSSATQEDLVPKDCKALGGLFSGDHPLFIGQQAKSELIFPKDAEGTPVGLKIEPDQMVKLEMHFINTTGAPLDVDATVHLDTVSLATTVVESDLAFWGTGLINVPANGSWDTGVKFQKGLADTHTFAVTTHQHHYGTRMQVWFAAGAKDPGMTPVADSTSWSDPPLEVLSPPVDFPTNGGSKLSTMGFAYKCSWVNTSPNDVKFGEGFNDEMCFLWHYYFPSQGFQMCMDGLCKTTK